MPLFGIDISHWQGTNVDLARVKREGFDFAIFKATDGSSFTDSRFARNLREGREAGLVVAAYHYQRGNTSAADQVAHIRRVVPKDCPVIPDVENGGGSIALTRDIIRRLKAAGYTVPLAYVPRWYWQKIGSPSLKGLPPLWSSRYVNSRGYASEIYEDVPDSYWDGYGGNTVAVLQYSSSATVAGHTPVDVNAYRGDRDELAALITGTPEEDDMPSAKEIVDELLSREIGDPFQVDENGKRKPVRISTSIAWRLGRIPHIYAQNEALQRATKANAAAIAALTQLVADHAGDDDGAELVAAARELTEAADRLANLPLATALVLQEEDDTPEGDQV